MAHSNSMTRIAFRQQGWFVRGTKLAGTQKLGSEKGCLQHYLGELQLVTGAGTARRTGIQAAAGPAGVAAGAGAGEGAGEGAQVGAGAGPGAAAGAAPGAAAGAAPGEAPGERRPTKAIASNMHAHRGRQQKQQRAKQWTLIVYLRRHQRRRHLGQPRTGQWRRHFETEQSTTQKRKMRWRLRRRKRRRRECGRQDQATGVP